MSLLRRFPIAIEGITAGYTTRHGGVSSGIYGSLNLGDHVGDNSEVVRRNRDLLAAELGVLALTVPDQKHQAHVVVVDKQLAGRGHIGVEDSVEAFGATDALVTNVVGTALTVMVADCAPVALVDPVQRAVGVAHCGRGGATLGVLAETVKKMVDTYGTEPSDLMVGIGPSIGAYSYEIGTREIEQVTKAFPDLKVLSPTREGHANLDISTILRHQLEEIGVPAENVHIANIDTLTSTEDYFSDRAQRPCGRFMGVAAITA